MGTRKDNAADRKARGTFCASYLIGWMASIGGNGGDRHPRSKLSQDQRVEIRRRYATGEKSSTLAAEYGICASHVLSIATGSRGCGLESMDGAVARRAPITAETKAAIVERYLRGERSRKQLATEHAVSLALVQKLTNGMKPLLFDVCEKRAQIAKEAAG